VEGIAKRGAGLGGRHCCRPQLSHFFPHFALVTLRPSRTWRKDFYGMKGGLLLLCVTKRAAAPSISRVSLAATYSSRQALAGSTSISPEVSQRGTESSKPVMRSAASPLRTTCRDRRIISASPPPAVIPGVSRGLNISTCTGLSIFSFFFGARV